MLFPVYWRGLGDTAASGSTLLGLHRSSLRESGFLTLISQVSKATQLARSPAVSPAQTEVGCAPGQEEQTQDEAGLELTSPRCESPSGPLVSGLAIMIRTPGRICVGEETALTPARAAPHTQARGLSKAHSESTRALSEGHMAW